MELPAGRPVCYGDHVLLNMDLESGILGAEGVLDNECRLIKNKQARMDLTTFRICLSYQYSAAKELKEYVAENAARQSREDPSLTGGGGSGGGGNNHNDGEHSGSGTGQSNATNDSQLRALTRGRLNEDKQNELAMQQKVGEPLRFGDTIQLQHVQSRKFLTIWPNRTAVVERENLLVQLDPAGSIMSHVKVCARLKIDEEVGVVMNNTDVFLKIAESEREQFIHASAMLFKQPSLAFSRQTPGSKSYLKDGESLEVNCSLEKTTWRMAVFDPVDAKDAFPNGAMDVRAGQVVYFHDPDTKMTLHLHDPHTMSRGELPGHGHANFDTFFKAHPDDGDDYVDSNAYWVLEKEFDGHGGPVYVGGEEPGRIKLRHMNSGRYMYMCDDLRMHKMASRIVQSQLFSNLRNLGKPKQSLSRRMSSVSEKKLGQEGAAAPARSPKPARVIKEGEKAHLVTQSDTTPYMIGSCQDPTNEATNFTLMPHRVGGGNGGGAGSSGGGEAGGSPTGGGGNSGGGGSPIEATRVATNVALNMQVMNRWAKIAQAAELTFVRPAEASSPPPLGKPDLSTNQKPSMKNDPSAEAKLQSPKPAPLDTAPDGSSSSSDGGGGQGLGAELARRDKTNDPLATLDDDPDRDAQVAVLDPSRVPCVAVVQRELAHPFVLRRIPPHKVDEAQVGTAAYPYFNAFNCALRDRREKLILQQWAPFLTIVKRMANFVCGRDYNKDSDTSDYDNAKPKVMRQRLMQEQGILGTAMDILHYVLDPSYAQGGRSDVANVARFEDAVQRVKKSVSRSLFQLLFFSLRKNPEIQIFCAKRLPIFVTHSEQESVATRCIVEMLSENRDLQESEVSEREVKVFVNMLRRNPMHPLFLNLLKAACECGGLGVDQNQQTVADIMMTNPRNKRLLINIEPVQFGNDSSRPTTPARPKTRDGRSESMKSPSSGAAFGKTPCDALVATWSCDECPEFGPMELYGKTHVPLVELFEVYEHRSVRSLKRTISIGSQYALVRVDPGTAPKLHPSLPASPTDDDPPKVSSFGVRPKAAWAAEATASPAAAGTIAPAGAAPAAAGPAVATANAGGLGGFQKSKMKGAMGQAMLNANVSKKHTVEWRMDLGQKMGMVITTSGLVGDVKAGSQASAEPELKVGSQILAVSGQSVQNLDDIKAAVAACKSRGETTATILYQPPGTDMASIARTMKALKTVSKTTSTANGGSQDESNSSSTNGGPAAATATPVAATGAPPPAASASSKAKPSRSSTAEPEVLVLSTEPSPSLGPSSSRPTSSSSFSPTSAGGALQVLKASVVFKARAAALHGARLKTPDVASRNSLEGILSDGDVNGKDLKKSGSSVGRPNSPPIREHFRSRSSGRAHHHHHHHHGPTVKQMRQKMVADYLIRQLYMLGSMCLGRNYVSMKLIQADFPYEQLVALITDDRMPNELRSAAIYLTTCLYVDSNPQCEQMIPNLVRCWSDVQPDGPVALPGGEEAQAVGTFNGNGSVDWGIQPRKSSRGLVARASLLPSDGTTAGFPELREVIVDHLVGLTRLSGDDFTLQLMGLLQKLMKFRFYTTATHMQEVVRPILRTLDDRKTTVDGPVDGPSSGGSFHSARVHPESGSGSNVRGSSSKAGSTKTRKKHRAMAAGLPGPRKLLQFMESIRVMLVILVVVLASVAIAAWGMITGQEPEWMAMFDLIVFIFFAIDIALRFACWVAMHSCSPWSFLSFWDVYRAVDGGCVMLDVSSMAASQVMGNYAAGSKLLKLLRLARLVRLVRAGNIMLAIMAALQADDLEVFEMPRRYDTMPRAELRMMANVVDVLTHVTRVAQDYRLSRMLQAFRAYRDVHTGVSGGRAVNYDGFTITLRTTPAELFEFVVDSSERGVQSLTLGAYDEVAYIMLNLCLYNYPPLVQSSLSLLMDQSCARKHLLMGLKDMQLLTTPAQERMLASLREKLLRLQSHAETFELWLQRMTKKDQATAKEMQGYLEDLVGFVESPDADQFTLLPLDHPVQAGNRRAQKMLHHLDGALVMTKVIREILPSLKDFENDAEAAHLDGDDAEADRCEELHESTRALLTLANRLICGYVRGNPDTQRQIHKDLDMFVKCIDRGVQSVQVVSEVFRGNSELIDQLDKAFVSDMSDKIANSEHNPDFIRVLGAVVQIGTVAHPELQSHILRELTQPGREELVMFLCHDPSSANYALRKELSAEARAIAEEGQHLPDETTLDHLPPLLSYHVTLVNLLAACASGSKNITIVEAKLQSIYPLDSLLEALLDHDLNVEVHIALVRYLRQAFVDVEMKYHGLASSVLLWRFFCRVPALLATCIKELETFHQKYAKATDSKDTPLLLSWSHSPSKSRGIPEPEVPRNKSGNGTKPADYEAVHASWGYEQRARLELLYETLFVLRLFFDESFLSSEVPATEVRAAEASANEAQPFVASGLKSQVPAPGVLREASSDSQRMYSESASSSAGSESSGEESEETNDEEKGKSTGADGGEDEAQDTAEWTQALLTQVVEGVRSLVEVGGLYLTNGFMIEAVDAAEMILSRSGLNDVVTHMRAPAFWLYPLGITDSHLAKFRKQRHVARHVWTVGDGDHAPPKLVAPRDKLPSHGLKVSKSLMEGHATLGLEADDNAEEQKDSRSFNGSRRSWSAKSVKEGAKEPVEALDDFIEGLESDELLASRIHTDLFQVASNISLLPSMFDGADKGDMRREYLVLRLVNHVYSSMRYGALGTKILEPACTQTTKWFLELCRNMIETKWGMSIDERDEDGGAEQDKAAAPVMLMLNQWGVTALCIDLISAGIHDVIKIAAIKLLIALLFKEGGHLVVQQTIRDHVNRQDSSSFFLEVKSTIVDLIAWHEAHPDGEGGCELPSGIIVIKCLQLMSEGHFKANQNLMRTQDNGLSQVEASASAGSSANGGPDTGDSESQAAQLTTKKQRDAAKLIVGNAIEVNLLDEMVDYLNVVSKIPHRVASQAATRVAGLVLEVLQGPCEANQLHFSRKTDLLEVLNRMMRSRTRNDQKEAEEKELKFTVVKIFQALLEGRKSTDELYKKVVGIVHLDVLISHVEIPALKILAEAAEMGQEFAIGGDNDNGTDGDESSGDQRRGSMSPFGVELDGGIEGTFDGESKAKPGVASGNTAEDEGEAEEIEEMRLQLQTQILVLLRMFSDYDPALKEDKAMRQIEELLDSEVKTVEIVWNGRLQRQFFHVPQPLCSLIGETTRENLVNSVNRTNQDNQLVDFTRQIHDVYLEVKWQETLGKWHLAIIFSRENQNRATWLSFMLAFLINSVYLGFYEYRTAEECEGEGVGMFNNIYTSKRRSWNKDPEADSYMEVPCMTPLAADMVGVLNYFQISVSIFTLVLYLVVMSKPKFSKAMATSELEGGWSFDLAGIDLAVDSWIVGTWRASKATWVCISDGFPPALYYFGYTVVCFVVQSYYPPMCAFLLLDIVVKSPTTSNVLKAVWQPRKQLLMTLQLLVYCVYIFSTVYFFSFRNEYVDDDTIKDDCETLYRCFLVNFNYGMRLSGGSGDIMVHEPDGGRVAVDYMYFFVVIVVLLNVVFGVIIDTFASLRENLMQKGILIRKFCFICGIPSENFDRVKASAASRSSGDDGGAGDDDDEKDQSGWSFHYHHDHNMWNYAYFMISLKEQDKDDDDGLELFVRHAMDDEDVEWFPKNVAMSLNKEGAKTEAEVMGSMLHSVERRIDESERNLNVAYEKRSEKLQRTVEYLTKQQREAQRQLQEATELLRSQAKQIQKLSLAERRQASFNNSVNENTVESNRGGGSNQAARTPPLAQSKSDSEIALGPQSSTPPLLASTPPPKPAWEEKVTVEVLDAKSYPPVGGGMGALTARVLWNGESRGDAETMWMSAKPSWFTGNKFPCARALGDSDELTVELLRKPAKAKKGVTPKAEVLGHVTLPWSKLKGAVLEGGKLYYTIESTASALAAGVFPGAELGIKVS